jgi:hypothetical protein
MLFVFFFLVCLMRATEGQMTLSERIAQATKDRVASASNHVVVNKNAERKSEATKPKPQPKKRATYTQQKKNAEKLRNKTKPRQRSL